MDRDERRYLDEAKRLLRAKMAEHPDEGVRLINEVVELADDHPAVIEIAAAIRALAGKDEA